MSFESSSGIDPRSKESTFFGDDLVTDEPDIVDDNTPAAIVWSSLCLAIHHSSIRYCCLAVWASQKQNLLEGHVALCFPVCVCSERKREKSLLVFKSVNGKMSVEAFTIVAHTVDASAMRM
jgi:hypothetical protein